MINESRIERAALAGHFEAKKHAIRQTQDGWVVSFVVHPNDMTPEFAAAPLGTHLMIGYQEIAGTEADEQSSAKDKYADKSPQEQAVARAAILCSDPEFQRWIAAGAWRDWVAKIDGRLATADDLAAAQLRERLRIKSRSEIATNHDAYAGFVQLEQEYRNSRSMSANQRGRV